MYVVATEGGGKKLGSLLPITRHYLLKVVYTWSVPVQTEE